MKKHIRIADRISFSVCCGMIIASSCFIVGATAQSGILGLFFSREWFKFAPPYECHMNIIKRIYKIRYNVETMLRV